MHGGPKPSSGAESTETKSLPYKSECDGHEVCMFRYHDE